MEIKILGSTLEDESCLSRASQEPVDGNVLGRWRYDYLPSMVHIITLAKKNGVVVMTSVYGDGSRGEQEMIVEKVRGETRYREKGSNADQFFIIKPNGDLAQGNDESGIWAVSRRLP